jgi:hypothetical protein
MASTKDRANTGATGRTCHPIHVSRSVAFATCLPKTNTQLTLTRNQLDTS